MLRVEFEYPFPNRNRLSGSPVHARERRRDTENVGYQAGRRLGQARGQPHFLDMITQGLFQPGEKVGKIPLLLLALGLVPPFHPPSRGPPRPWLPTAAACRRTRPPIPPRSHRPGG